TVTTQSALLNESFRTSSSTIAIVPADMHHFTVTAADTSVMSVGESRQISVTAYDAYNNLTGYAGPLSLTFTGANSSPAPSIAAATCSNSSGVDVAFGQSVALTFTNSVATTTFKPYKAEVTSIKATTGSITTSTEHALALTVKHGAANHLKFADNLPTPQAAGTAFNFDTTLDAVDIYDNICDGANGAAAYNSSGRTVIYTLSGVSDGPESGTDIFINPVAFSAGRSTTPLSATLYRGQSTTITPSTTDLTGTNVASNTLLVNAAAVNRIRFSQQPSTAGTTNVAFAEQPQVAISDAYGNPCSNVTGQVTLRASSTSGAYTPVVNGSLSSASGLTVTSNNGVATFTGVKYSYPEEIYLEAQASVSGYTVNPIYSYKMTLSTLNELTVQLVTAGISNTVSSVANTAADKVPVFAFRVTDAGVDGYSGSMTKITINRDTTIDTSSDWTDFISGAYLSDGTIQILGTITANTITFGSGNTVVYYVPNGSNKTYTLSLILKPTLPEGADNKVFAFSADVNDDILMASPTTSTYAQSAALTDNATLTVVATKFKVTGSGGETSLNMNAGTETVIVLKAVDANNNLDTDYHADVVKNIVFTGANVSGLNNAPTATDLGGGDTPFGTSTPIQFSGGVNTSTVTLKLYKSETAFITATDDSFPALTTSGGDRLTIVVAGGAAATLTWSTQPNNKAVASSPWKEFVVAVSDAYGNVSSSSSEITVSPTGGTTTPASTATVTAVNGLATFSNYAVTCASYPGTVTLVASGAGVAPSAASGAVTVDERFSIVFTVVDSVNASALTELKFSATDAASGATVLAESTKNSPFTLSGANSIDYGTYNFKFAKDLYVETTVEKTVG
ncbi:MAG: hypothetical protein WC551_14615, partial [Patescibacteria group bacterium]